MPTQIIEQMSKKKEALNFENSLERLETIIESMENGNISLDDLVTKFEEGATLLKTCHKNLQKAELKLEKLNLENDQLDPFESQELDD